MTDLKELLQARDEALKAREEGRVLVFPKGVSLDEAKHIHAKFLEAGGGNIQFPDDEEIRDWLLFGDQV
jgi:hypothetical protein